MATTPKARTSAGALANTKPHSKNGTGTGTGALNPSGRGSNAAEGLLGVQTQTLSHAQAGSTPGSGLAPYAGILPSSILGGTTTGGYGYQHGYGPGFGLGYGYGNRYGLGYNHGYRGPYRYGRRNYVTMSSQALNRMRRLQRLIADLDALSPGTAASPLQQTALRNDLQALAPGSYRTNRGSVQNLAGGLATALPQRSRRLLDTARLAGDLEVVVNAAHLPAGQVSRAVGDAHTVLRSSGVGQSHLQGLVLAMRSVGAVGGLGNALGVGAGLANRMPRVR
jgi:hypothetical protein